MSTKTAKKSKPDTKANRKQAISALFSAMKNGSGASLASMEKRGWK